MAYKFLITFLIAFFGQLAHSFQTKNSAFGSCEISANINFQHSGSKNTGSVQSNTNTMLSATNCSLNIKSNTNVQISAVNSNIDCTSCTNLGTSGQDNKIISRSNTNTNLNGNNNDWDATSNTGLTIRSSYSVMKLGSNINGIIQTDNCSLTAITNTGLTVTGNNCKLEIRNTTNHIFRQVESGKKGVDNQLEISLSKNNGVNYYNNNNIASNRNVNVTYVDEAFVDGQNYKIGQIPFSLTPEEVKSYKIKINSGNLATDAIKQLAVSEKEVLVTVTRNGTEHNLRIKGDPVTINSDHSITLFPKIS